MNVTYERYIFKQGSQRKDENTINFVTRLKSLAETCNFTNTSDAVKDQFISSCCSKKLKQKLLREKDINLEKCIEIARDSEIAKVQADEMKTNEESLPVNLTKTTSKTRRT